MTDYLKIIFATLFFSLPVYCVSAQDLPEKQNNTSAVPDKHTASDTEKQTENQDRAADLILPDHNSAEQKDPEIALFEKNCSASLAFNGSPYEHASCVVIYDMLKIELTPKAEFTENIKNADMNRCSPNWQKSTLSVTHSMIFRRMSLTSIQFRKTTADSSAVSKLGEKHCESCSFIKRRR